MYVCLNSSNPSPLHRGLQRSDESKVATVAKGTLLTINVCNRPICSSFHKSAYLQSTSNATCHLSCGTESGNVDLSGELSQVNDFIKV
jgi:hypothetical protein